MYSSSSKGISKIPKPTKRTDGNKKAMKGSNDSGLTKNLSITGTSQPVVKDAPNKAKGSCMNLKESSLRKQLRAVIMSDSKFEPLSSRDTLVKQPKTTNRPLPDPNKVNELDCLNNRNQSRPYPLGKTFFSQIMRTQFKISSKRKTFRERTTPVTPFSKRKIKKPLSDSDDETMSHIKYIANCLLENTLNKLDIKESSKLIADHIDDPVVQTPESGGSFCSDLQVLDVPSSTYNGNDEANTVSEDTIVDLTETPVENNASIASREALYDPNSRADMLEDFDMSPLLEGFESVHNISTSNPPNNVVLLGIHALNEEDSGHQNRTIFPSWLLRLLRNNVPINNPRTNEWAYFYSQGDGWANNTPWFIQNSNDENDDASSEASTSSSSIAEGDDGSSFQDIVSIPDDSRAISNGNQDQRGYVRLQERESEEYFDSLDNLGAVPK